MTTGSPLQQSQNARSDQELNNSVDMKEIQAATLKESIMQDIGCGAKQLEVEAVHLSQAKPESSITIEMLPQELLDEIVSYLREGKDMIRFCRAIPALNEYASTLYSVGGLHPQKRLALTDLWPNCLKQGILIDNKVVKAYTSLLDRFNGYTELSGVHISDIATQSKHSSRNLLLRLSPRYVSSHLIECGKFVTLHQKKVIHLEFSVLKELPEPLAFQGLNPTKVVMHDAFWNEDISYMLQFCSCILCFEVRYKDLGREGGRERLVRKLPSSPLLPSLRELILVNTSRDIVSDVIQSLCRTNIQRLELKMTVIGTEASGHLEEYSAPTRRGSATRRTRATRGSVSAIDSKANVVPSAKKAQIEATSFGKKEEEEEVEAKENEDEDEEGGFANDNLKDKPPPSLEPTPQLVASLPLPLSLSRSPSPSPQLSKHELELELELEKEKPRRPSIQINLFQNNNEHIQKDDDEENNDNDDDDVSDVVSELSEDGDAVVVGEQPQKQESTDQDDQVEARSATSSTATASSSTSEETQESLYSLDSFLSQQDITPLPTDDTETIFLKSLLASAKSESSLLRSLLTTTASTLYTLKTTELDLETTLVLQDAHPTLLSHYSTLSQKHAENMSRLSSKLDALRTHAIDTCMHTVKLHNDTFLARRSHIREDLVSDSMHSNTTLTSEYSASRLVVDLSIPSSTSSSLKRKECSALNTVDAPNWIQSAVQTRKRMRSATFVRGGRRVGLGVAVVPSSGCESLGRRDVEDDLNLLRVLSASANVSINGEVVGTEESMGDVVVVEFFRPPDGMLRCHICNNYAQKNSCSFRKHAKSCRGVKEEVSDYDDEMENAEDENDESNDEEEEVEKDIESNEDYDQVYDRDVDADEDDEVSNENDDGGDDMPEINNMDLNNLSIARKEAVFDFLKTLPK
ncbi:hypothetical protein HDU79_000328 [Rhizoclosmatium sp. JEL0117]|nr:hypothetical protein HDU79_000328 [Rhizoclosmatium sp. JEL0117]